MAGLNIAGTIDFRHDNVNDIVISRPRWALATSVDVMRWYQMHASYFGARFTDKKDVIVVNDAFDVSPKVATLWGQYRARLHETYVRYSVRVSNNARVRLTTNTSAARYSISALECDSVDEAVAAILASRQMNETATDSIRAGGAGGAGAGGVNESGVRFSGSMKATRSSRPPKSRSSEGT
jgi:hypothetical protein